MTNLFTLLTGYNIGTDVRVSFSKSYFKILSITHNPRLFRPFYFLIKLKDLRTGNEIDCGNRCLKNIVNFDEYYESTYLG
jgi:hypothetical protein